MRTVHLNDYPYGGVCVWGCVQWGVCQGGVQGQGLQPPADPEEDTHP